MDRESIVYLVLWSLMTIHAVKCILNILVKLRLFFSATRKCAETEAYRIFNVRYYSENLFDVSHWLD